MNWFRKFVSINQKSAYLFDTILPSKFTIDGNSYFKNELVPKYILPNSKLYDVGSGRSPCISEAQKDQLNLNIVGLDIDPNELKKAPPNLYDNVICADITTYCGNEDADVVICQALLEHVKDVEAAFRSMRTILKYNGMLLIFVPSRNAVFARLNMLLPQDVKKTLLYTIYPHTVGTQGFKSYYDKCTPAEFDQLAKKHGFVVKELSPHYISSYFSFFLPLYIAWRLWILLLYLILRKNAAETFSIVLEKKI